MTIRGFFIGGLKIFAALIALLIAGFILAACVPGRYASIQRVEPPNLKYWDLPSGSRIGYTAYLAGENRKDISLIYLHGGPGGYVYNMQRELFSRLTADGYDVFLYDQIGSGFSARLDNIKDYTMQRQLDDLYEIVQRTGNAKVVLVGQSFGSTISVQFAADHPEHIHALVLTSPGEAIYGIQIDETAEPPVELTETETPNGELTAKILLPRNLSFALAAQNFGWKMVSDEEADGFITSMEPLFTQGMVCDPANVIPSEGGAGAYVQLRTRDTYTPSPDLKDTIEQHSFPILITIGSCEADQWPGVQQYFAFSDRYEFEVIEGAGHQSYAEQPGAYIGLIRDFLKRIE